MCRALYNSKRFSENFGLGYKFGLYNVFGVHGDKQTRILKGLLSMGGKHIMVACILAYSGGYKDIFMYLWSNCSKLMDGI